MADVFVSYARDDRAKVEQLAHALEARGFDVWWDPDLLPGEQYAQRIQQILSEAKAVIVVWSEASVARSWVRDEADVGLGRGVLVPVKIAAVDPPLGYRQTHTEDLSHWPGAEGDPAFERVALALEGLRGRASDIMPAAPELAQRRRTISRLGIGFGVLAALVIGVLAVMQIAGPSQTAIAPPAEPGAPAAPDTTTDSPGAADLYGFERTELAQLTPQELIATALQNTTIETIEADAQRGDPLGRLLLCLARAYGEGAPKNAFVARSVCESAAAAGEPQAIYQLSLFHRAGEAGYTESRVDADRELKRAADAGDPRAQTDLAEQSIAAGRAQEGYQGLSQAAEQGYRPAQVALGALYEQGRGVPQDYRTALLWYDRAAEMGSPSGLRAVGVLYEEGKGVGQDFQRARDQYTQASELGDGEASLRLARMFERGQGGGADIGEARRYYQRAREQGAEAAQAEIDRVGHDN